MNIERRLKWAGILIGGGLAIQVLTLLPIHPLAFMAFLMVGSPLVVGGTILFLTSLLPGRRVIDRDGDFSARGQSK